MPSRNGSSVGTTTSSPTSDLESRPVTRTEQIRSRLLAGEQLDSLSMTAEYDVSRGMFTQLVRELKKQGHVFSEVRTSPTEPIKYQIAQVNDPRSNYEKVSGSLIAGERLKGSDLTEQGMKPQLLSVTIARLKQMGYLVDHEDTQDGKVWFVTGKGEPPPREQHPETKFVCPDCEFETSNAGGFGGHMAAHRRGTEKPQPRVKRRSTGVSRSAPKISGSGPRTGGSRSNADESRTTASRRSGGGLRPKMPAPELDAATDFVLVHRISPDEVEVAFRQGTRQWLVAVRSCIED